ncbi:type I polyketide synthase [Streptomyces mesophilus]|uniref:type I polyketide synthase n=1 Tax=Streptomyces mesophilus TaxID=1775132 RepID=UPI003326DEB5
MSGAAADIAVIGMSCRFPGVHDPDGFWRLLRDGESTIGTFPGQRADDANSRYAAHPDAATLGSGSFFDSVDGFDAGFFGIGAAEAAAMDPAQRLGLELAWEAVENARLAADTLAGREVDVVVGAAASGYDLLRKLSGSDQDDHYAALGSSGALIANRISNFLDVRGMSFSADSGQSSSLVSLALTCERIRSGAVDLALAGGVQLVVDPEAGAGLANLGALSPDGRCYPFDAKANGFTRGEGGAFVLLKRADLALADGDHIHALIRGWGVASAGASARMPDPSPTGQAAAVRSALTRAGIDFDDVDYVEAHGTGTRLGDPAELSGLRQVSGPSGRTRPLAVGSVKANVGHLEPAAGIVGFVKAALCVEHGHLVPTPGFTTANPAVEDFHRDFEVLRATRPWPGTAQRPRRAGVSSIGMGGTNAHVILEQAPTPYEAAHDAPHNASHDAVEDAPRNASHDATGRPDAPVAWVLSARSESALRAQAARLHERVAADPVVSREDVAHALVSTRTAFEHRAVVVADDREEALAGLTDLAAGDTGTRVIRGTATGPAGPVVLVFPGQGSQWAGMGRQLYAQSEVFARSIDACSRALEPWQDWSLVDLVTGAASAPSLEDGDSVVQPALFSVMVSLAHLWRSLGVVPDAVVGHSQGEIAAACVAGALSLEDAARVVALRSQALAPLVGQGGMSAVGASQQWVEERLVRWAGRLSVAVANGPASVVISGDPGALDEFEAAAHGEGIRARRLKVDYASHSHHVERVRDQVLRAAEGIAPRPAEVEFHSTVTTGLLDGRALDASYWYSNLRSTVRFGEVIEHLMRERGGVYVEVSPHPILQIGMEEAADALTAPPADALTAPPADAPTAPPAVVSTLNRQDGGLATVLRSLGSLHVRGVPVDWAAANAAMAGNPAPRRIALPTYPFQRQRHWLKASPSSDAAHDTAGHPDTAGVRAADLDSAQAVRALVCTETAALLATRGAALSGAEVQARATETFKSLGFDSSMAIDLRNRLGEAAAQRLPATVAFTYPTPQQLADHLWSRLEPDRPQAEPGAEDTAGPVPADSSDDDLYALIDSGYV